MRIARHAGKLTLLVEGGGVDVGRATGGRFGAPPLEALDRWDEFAEPWPA
ncbi:hypothetical protein [Lentzea sp. HUAS12]|nr:hypothetical protein [Lentzea sp. HUAS12]USX56297.1 hypothetical protein ND450_20000 [Lentzea sp. HUAS12]